MCFGSNEKPCPYDNLYRIIGVFDDKVKLIKSTFITCDILGINNCTSYGQVISDNWRNDLVIVILNIILHFGVAGQIHGVKVI